MAFSFSSKAATVQLMNLIRAAIHAESPAPEDTPEPTDTSRVKVLDADTRLEYLRY